MINIKELRIGNLISDDEGVLAKVNGFTPFEHSVRCDEEEGCHILVDCYHASGARRTGCETDSPECNPIPLTPEWLERCGFEDGEIRPSYKLHMDVRPYETATQGIFPGEWAVTLVDTVPHQLGNTIRYVHQLQNLYFALTGGEELEIKPF